MTCDAWDVVVVPFPFTDRATTRRRHALVVSAKAFNRHGHSVLAMIPVAILTTSVLDGDPADFDAASVAPSSVAFGPGGATMVHGTSHFEDVDGDGDLDLVLHFRTGATGIACGDDMGSLAGETFEGSARGCAISSTWHPSASGSSGSGPASCCDASSKAKRSR